MPVTMNALMAAETTGPVSVIGRYIPRPMK